MSYKITFKITIHFLAMTDLEFYDAVGNFLPYKGTLPSPDVLSKWNFVAMPDGAVLCKNKAPYALFEFIEAGTSKRGVAPGKIRDVLVDDDGELCINIQWLITDKQLPRKGIKIQSTQDLHLDEAYDPMPINCYISRVNDQSPEEIKQHLPNYVNVLRKLQQLSTRPTTRIASWMRAYRVYKRFKFSGIQDILELFLAGPEQGRQPIWQTTKLGAHLYNHYVRPFFGCDAEAKLVVCRLRGTHPKLGTLHTMLQKCAYCTRDAHKKIVYRYNTKRVETPLCTHCIPNIQKVHHVAQLLNELWNELEFGRGLVHRTIVTLSQFHNYNTSLK